MCGRTHTHTHTHTQTERYTDRDINRGEEEMKRI